MREEASGPQKRTTSLQIASAPTSSEKECGETALLLTMVPEKAKRVGRWFQKKRCASDIRRIESQHAADEKEHLVRKGSCGVAGWT
jgi:hypothetical protein